MEDKTRNLVNKGMPWRGEANWMVVAAEAVVLVVIGIYILVDKSRAGDVALQLIGVILLATSLLLGFARLRNDSAKLGAYDAFRAGIGVAIGAIATASWWSEDISDTAVRDILGWGLIAYSVLHLVGMVLVRGRQSLRPMPLLIVGLTLVLGIILLTGNQDSLDSRMTLLGTVVLVFGVLLGALAYYLYSKEAKPVATPPAAPPVAS
jgi:uncharacterized membrane protein HdeD (DUF308 family)